jgi:hypothetical protein
MSQVAGSMKRCARLASLAATILVFVGTAASWGTLCIGADGHVAFEAAAAGNCVGETPSGGAPSGAASATAAAGAWPCCGPCTDLDRIGADWLAGNAPEPEPVALAVAPWTRGAEAPPARTPRYDAAPPPASIALRALASAILRC